MSAEWTQRKLVAGLALLVAAGLGLGGCPAWDTSPPPEAVLAGTWKLVTSQTTQLTETYLTFDDRGELVTITYKIGSNATITNERPQYETEVAGDSVRIESNFFGNGLTFIGELNAEQTEITGQSGTEFRLGFVTVSLDNGPLSLVRQ